MGFFRPLLLAFLFLPGGAWAEEGPVPLRELRNPGLHIFAGVGINGSSFEYETGRQSLGLGSNFKTDVMWMLTDTWSLESSASVKFNQVKDNLVWDTLLTLGVRARFRDPILGYDANYWRAFVGAAPTVLLLDVNQRIQFDGASRIQMQGPVVGGGLGTYFISEKGNVYFFEMNATAQYIQRLEVIKMEGETPFVTAKMPVTDNSRIYSIVFNVGVLLF